MNKIDFTQQGGFPLIQDTLGFLQAAYAEALGGLATIAGDKVILSGCETQNNVVRPGLVSVGGEILYTPGGAASTVFVRETTTSATFEDGVAKAVYKRRTLAFGVGSPQWSWSEFKRLGALIDTFDLSREIAPAVAPAGLVCMWSGAIENIPAGWALCDGTNGTPDLRGRFIVGAGAANGSGRNSRDADPDHAYAVGETGGMNKFKQIEVEVASHIHFISSSSGGSGSRPLYDGYNDGVNWNDRNIKRNQEQSAVAAMENRPRFYALAYIQKK